MRKKLLHLLLHSPSSLSSLSNPNFLLIKHISSSSSSSSLTKPTHQEQEELIKKANLLIPRLCESNHLREAIRLIDAVLLTNPPPNSLSLSILIDRITNQPDMTESMALLNSLKHNPTAHPFLPQITRSLIDSYFKKRKIKEPMKVFNWILKTQIVVSAKDAEICYELVIRELCRNFRVLEALRVLKMMFMAEMVPGSEIRTWVFRVLLREARIDEAQEINKVLNCEEGFQKMVELMDQILEKWKEQ